MKEMAHKRTLICKIFWGNLLEAHALGAPTCIISSFRAERCLPIVLQKEINVWAIPFIYYTYKIFIDWVTVKLSELQYGLTVLMLKKISQNFYVCVQK